MREHNNRTIFLYSEDSARRMHALVNTFKLCVGLAVSAMLQQLNVVYRPIPSA